MAPPPPNWLSQFPQKRRSLLANLFYGAVRLGLTKPKNIVAHVTHECHKRRQWAADEAEDQHWARVLQAMRDNPTETQAYAQTVLANETLPRDERKRQKREVAKPFILASMRGKPATAAQHWRLRKEGYTGALPDDRAEASALLGRVLAEKHAILPDKPSE
jgi:hypothetical protein